MLFLNDSDLLGYDNCLPTVTLECGQRLLSGRSFEDVIGSLNGLRETPSLEKLKETLAGINLTTELIEPYVRFNARHYTRNLVAAGKHYELFLTCWRPGQGSPIHDHAQSACAIRVVQGCAIETVFERHAGGYAHAVATHTLSKGTVTGSTTDEIHQIEAIGALGLVTLELYSPRLELRNMAVFQRIFSDGQG